MSATPDSIEDYIAQTLSNEEQAVREALQSQADYERQQEMFMRSDLEKALERDDKIMAIRIAHQLMENDSEDEDVEALYMFLLERVGVPIREPFFSLSVQPFVSPLSAVAAVIPLSMLAFSFLSSTNAGTIQAADVLACISASAVLSIPFFDMLFAASYNRRNHFRLMD